MLFRRKNKLSLLRRMRLAIWPTNGWRRTGLYVWHRLARLSDSPHGIAAGVASGVAISFTPFMGFHLMGAMGLALATRGNVLAAWIGTLVGNPWTFPFIWILIYRIGSFLLGLEHVPVVNMPTLDALIAEPALLVKSMLLPMMAGGIPLALLAWFVSYWPVKRAIERFQARRRERLHGAMRMRAGSGLGEAGR